MKESLLTETFWHAGIFLVLSALVIPILKYCKIPVALGYLLAGIILGPYALGALVEEYPILHFISLEDAEHIKVLAELGIVLLLFVIGLEMTPRRLWQMRHLVFGLGGSQVLISAAIIGSIAYLWGNNFQVSVLLGLGLSLSSTALVSQWLHKNKMFVTHTGRASFGILLFQDLAVVPILLLLTIMSTQGEGPIIEFVALSLLKMIGTAFIIYFVGRLILKPLFIFANRHGGSEVFMALSLLIIITSASIASSAGLSMALGAFIAGVLLADTQYRHEITALINPFKSMLLGIFFVSFGMSIDLHYVVEKPIWLFLSVLGLMVIKTILIFPLCKAWGQTNAVAAETSVLLAQAGEFGLLVVGSALAVGLMAEDVGQFMLIMVGLTMMLTPMMAPLSQRLGRYIDETSLGEGGEYLQDVLDSQQNHVVIFGYGRMGQAIANIIGKEGVNILAFDNNVDHVQKGRTENIPVYFGDASKQSTLSAAQLEKATCVVIAIDDVDATRRIIKSIRENDFKLPIIVRAPKPEHMDEFQNGEHIYAIAEHAHISSKISEKILENFLHRKNREQDNQNEI